MEVVTLKYNQRTLFQNQPLHKAAVNVIMDSRITRGYFAKGKLPLSIASVEYRFRMSYLAEGRPENGDPAFKVLLLGFEAPRDPEVLLPVRPGVV